VQLVATVHRRRAALLLAILIVLVGSVWDIRAAFPLASVIAAGGLIWPPRKWWRWPMAASLVAGGLLWASLDQSGCSVWLRSRIAAQKLLGNLPYVGWSDIARNVLTPCATWEKPDPRTAERVLRLDQKTVGGRELELYQTDLGRFWIPAPGRHLLTFLLWELTVQHDYESGEIVIRPGDTVIDCGAHVGTFSRFALQRGAKRVVAIEPDPDNLTCLEANFAREIANETLVLVKAGVWDTQTHLKLWERRDGNSGGNSLVVPLGNGVAIENVPLLPLDDIVTQLRLERVDFVKMDIEGAERHALWGAQQTLKRFRPRMAISAYHLADDGRVIPLLVKKLQPAYQITAKDIDPFREDVRAKVLFFY